MSDWTSLRYVVIDVEGNGQQPPELVELGLVSIVDGEVGAPTSWLVKPVMPITPMARRIHGIRNEDVAEAPLFADIRNDVLAHLGDGMVIAHNAHVDLGVLERELRGWQRPGVFDTLKLARRLLPGQASYRLGALVDTFGLAVGLPEGLTPHRATYDVLVTARLFVHLASSRSLEELRGAPSEGDGHEAEALF